MSVTEPAVGQGDISVAAGSGEDAMHRAFIGPADCADASCAPELPAAAAQAGVETKTPARWAYERLALYMQAFEQGLNAEEELAMGFTGGDAGVLRIEGIGYFDPDIVTFYGTDDEGMKTQLIQHVTQLNVMLRAMPKPELRAEPARIGFRLVRELSEPEAAPQASPAPLEPTPVKAAD